MKPYTKTHSSKKVADIHLQKIKKRGGTATMKPVPGGFKIDYSFPEATASRKATPKTSTVPPKPKARMPTE